MNYRGYPERDLVANRSSLLLYGGGEADRRAWAEEAWWNLHAASGGNVGPMRVATNAAELKTALGTGRGLLYVPDVAALDELAQGELVRVLHEREERPKLVLGAGLTPDRARETGKLRSDLQYALQMAQVNLDEPGLKDAIRSRRAKAPKRGPAPVAGTPAPAMPVGARPMTSTSSASAAASSSRSPKAASSASSAKSKKSAAAKGRRSTSRAAAPRAARRAPKPAAKKKARAPAKKSAAPRRRR